MILPAVSLVPVWVGCSPDCIRCLAFLSCGGLMFVGTAPLFKEEFQGRVHYAGTVIAGTATVLWVCFSGMWYLPAVAFPAAGFLILRCGKWLFWLELAAFGCAYAGVLIRMI